MKSIIKKLVALSLVCLMQVGIGASITEASAKHPDKPPHECYEHHDNDREQRIKEEKARHEREMQRRAHESDQEYRERQERERKHHEEIMRALGALALITVVVNND